MTVPIAHHLSHDRLVHGAEGAGGIAHLEEIEIRIGDAVLHDPLDDRHVQIAGQHHRLGAEVVGAEGGAHGGLGGPEAELLLQLPLNRNLVYLLDERNLHPKARLRGPDVLAKSDDHPDFFGLNLIQRHHQQDQDGERAHDPDKPSAGAHGAVAPHLEVADVLVVFVRAAPPGVPAKWIFSILVAVVVVVVA